MNKRKPSSTPRLTKAQRRLIRELNAVTSEFNLEWCDVASRFRDPRERTTHLEFKLRQIARGLIIHWYTVIDECLANKICRYHFGRTRSFPALWRTKRFRNFNHYVTDELTLLQKLRYVRTFFLIPKEVVGDIESFNALRNALAHSFFPENRRAKALWKDEDIFSLAGLRKLYADFERMRRVVWET